MKKIQELPLTKEIAPNLPTSRGDIKTFDDLIMGQKLSYIKNKAALKGISVSETKTGYLVTQWAMAKTLKNTAELTSFLRKIGVHL